MRSISEEMKVTTTPKTLWALGGIIVMIAIWVARVDFIQANQGKDITEVKAGLIDTDKDRVIQREKMILMLNRIDNRLSRIEGKLGIPEARN